MCKADETKLFLSGMQSDCTLAAAKTQLLLHAVLLGSSRYPPMTRKSFGGGSADRTKLTGCFCGSGGLILAFVHNGETISLLFGGWVVQEHGGGCTAVRDVVGFASHGDARK